MYAREDHLPVLYPAMELYTAMGSLRGEVWDNIS